MALTPDIMTVASLIGSVAFALSGFLAGVREKLDVMGIFILAMLTANGGGALRDVLVGRTPLVLTTMEPFLLVLAVMCLAMLLRVHRRASIENHRAFVACDAVGLAAFGLTGSIVGIQEGLSLFGVMTLAFVTASGGGIIRDLMVNRIPSIMNSDFYGSVAVLIAIAVYVLDITGHRNDLTLGAVLAAALVLRLIAHYKGWRLPRLTL